jgi:Flp pilus assembly protein TadG
MMKKKKSETLGIKMEESIMEPHNLSSETLRKWMQCMVVQRLIRQAQGQVLAIFAIALPVIFGGGAIAVDIGHLFVARNTMQNAADAGARAGASILANGGSESDAAAAASDFANQNMTFPSYFTGATTNVTFPTAASVQVSITHNLPLFLAPVIGLDTASVAATASAELAATSTVAPNAMVPLSIYCNNPAGCAGTLGVGQLLNLRRYCGNYFMDGPEGNDCGNDIADGENFLAGITFDDNNSTNDFRTLVRTGYSNAVTLGQMARALPGNRNGWQDGMTDRLAAGQNEIVLPVIREASNPNGEYNVEIIDFIKVRIHGFSTSRNTDETSFEIIRSQVTTSEFAEASEGLNIDSVVGVRLSQ